MKAWLRETHGPWFELLRHFLARFFDSELTTTPGQAKSMLIWAFAMIAPWFLMFGQAVAEKYRFFAGMAAPGPYRYAVRADELWLLTLMMSAVGLLAAVKWQSLFPGLRDYRALGSLPLRARQIFGAKLIALLTVATAAVVTLNALPSLIFPAVSGGRWVIQPSLMGRVAAHATTSIAACYFFFFALVALQGVLLNVLPGRTFARVSGTAQGLCAATMLILMVLSFSIGSPVIGWVERSAVAPWLPPVWFLGLYQRLMGDPDQLMAVLANRAESGLGIAVAIALASYLVSYRRHREVMMEGAVGGSRDRRWAGAALDLVVRSPRQQAIFVFLWRTMGRSTQHRMVMMAYAGLGVAAVATVCLGIGQIFQSTKALTAYFVYSHVILLLFLLAGFRHLFSIPTELRANWMFQITEGEGRDEWLEAIDHFVLYVGAAFILAIPFPIEVKLIGWRAVGEIALVVAVGLVGYEWLFAEWRKMPFTCSRLPGKTPLWITFLYVLAMVTSLPFVNALLVMSLFSGAGFTAVVVLAGVMWRRVHAARREAWGELRLTYDELPDPAIHGLNLGA